MPIPSIPPSLQIPTLPIKVWRGFSPAMTPSIQGYNFSTQLSQTLRSRAWANFRLRETACVFETFAPITNAGSIMDVPHPFGLNFQCAIEPTYAASLTGLTPRKPFTFSGSTVANYAYITGVSISQNSTAITCTNILGTIAIGQPIFYNTTIIGYVESFSGITSITLKNNYTGLALSSVNCTSNNGYTQVAGLIQSDPMDLGTYIQPGPKSAPNFFGIHTTVECPTQTFLNGSTYAHSTNTLTTTSVTGPFNVGSPVYLPVGGVATFIGTVATITTPGTTYVLTSTYGADIVSAVTGWCQGLPYQRTSSNFLQRYTGFTSNSTQATGTAGVTTASNTVSITTGANWAAGMSFNANIQTGSGNTIPNGTYVTQASAASGTLTLTLNNPVTLVATTAIVGSQSNIGQDIARSQVTYGGASLTPVGNNNYFTPCMLMGLTNSASVFGVALGDSIGQGTGEGTINGSFTGTIASNVLTVNSAFNGAALFAGASVYGAANAVIGTLGSNISGAGNGSTWNITASNVGPIVMYYTSTALYGDPLGSQLGNSGWIERGMNEILGYSITNISRGSDSNYTWSSGSNSQFRQQILQLANPSHVILAMVHNDIAHFTGTVATAWAANASLTIGSVRSGLSATSDYLLVGTTTGTNTGLSGSTAPSGTTYGQNIIDGQLIWQYLYPHVGGGAYAGGSSVVASTFLVNKMIRSLLPGANFMQQLPTPDAGSSDLWATTANQTPTTNGWGITGAGSGNAIQTGGQIGTTTVAISSGANWTPGMQFNAPGNSPAIFVQSLGTYSAGTGTLILSAPVTITSSTAVTGFYNTRMTVYSMYSNPTIQALLNLNANNPLIDPNVYWELNGTGQSGKFNVTGVSYGESADGTHPNSYGHYLVSQAVQAQLFQSIY